MGWECNVGPVVVEMKVTNENVDLKSSDSFVSRSTPRT